MRRLALLLASTLALGCSDPRAGLELTDARAWRADDGRVVVDVDLLAHEGLGGNIGTYCTRVTFQWQDHPAEVCRADLEDGDTATVRLLSDARLGEGTLITVRVRHAAVDQTRTLAAPR